MTTPPDDLGLARQYQRAGQFQQAEQICRQILLTEPSHSEAHNELGIVFAKTGRSEDAIAEFREALRLAPKAVGAWNNLGKALAEQGRGEDAAACYHEALRLAPTGPRAWLNLGILRAEQGREGEATACFQEVVRLKPDYAEGHYNLGKVLLDLGQPDQALAQFEEAIRLRIDYSEAHLGRAMVWLLQGDYEKGWPEYEWRLKCGGFRGVRSQGANATPLARWDDSSLSRRTILLAAEQGLGDAIQFIRYAAMVKERGGTVIVEAQSKVLPVLAACPGVDRLVETDTTLPEFDFYAPLLNLPAIFGTTVATIPARTPYLFADSDRVERWRQELKPIEGSRIGIVWQGDPRNKGDRKRSVRLEQFSPLARIEGVRLVSLQVGPGTEQVAALADRFPLIDLGGRFDSHSLMDAAAALKSLDLIITVDTAIAHLAGAMGVLVWVLLPYASDFRWMLSRDDSPWYPSMRLWRQSEPGDWSGVFDRLAQAIANAAV
jgi:Flp pilus assembly protein TadD